MQLVPSTQAKKTVHDIQEDHVVDFTLDGEVVMQVTVCDFQGTRAIGCASRQSDYDGGGWFDHHVWLSTQPR